MRKLCTIFKRDNDAPSTRISFLYSQMSIIHEMRVFKYILSSIHPIRRFFLQHGLIPIYTEYLNSNTTQSFLQSAKNFKSQAVKGLPFKFITMTSYFNYAPLDFLAFLPFS